MLSFLGGIVGNFVLGIAKWFGGLFLAYRQGEKAQAQKDLTTEAEILEKQRDDANAGPVDPRVDRSKL